MSYYPKGLGDALMGMVQFSIVVIGALSVLGLILIPLGIWKAIELISKIKISIG